MKNRQIIVLIVIFIIFGICIFEGVSLKKLNTSELEMEKDKISTVIQTTEEMTELTTVEITEELTEIVTEIKYTKGTFDSLTYGSNFDYDNSEFVSDYVYKKLKKAYDEIDFSGEFRGGDTKLYDLYKRKFAEVILNKKTFYYSERNNKEEYLYDEDIDPTQIFCSLHILDFDGDNEPELCVNYRKAYVFKYLNNEDKVVLMTNSDGSWNRFYGTKKIYDEWEGIRYTYDIYDENYEIINEVKYYYTPVREGFTCYMVAFPGTNRNQKKELDIDIQREGYDLENTDIIYFKVTEEQYYELTKKAYKRSMEADKELKKYEISYDELVSCYKEN